MQRIATVIVDTPKEMKIGILCGEIGCSKRHREILSLKPLPRKDLF